MRPPGGIAAGATGLVDSTAPFDPENVSIHLLVDEEFAGSGFYLVEACLKSESGMHGGGWAGQIWIDCGSIGLFREWGQLGTEVPTS